MGRFTPDLKKVSAGFPNLESGEWEFIVGDPRGFYYVKDSGKEVYGIRYPLEIAGQIKADGSLDTDDDRVGKQAFPHKLYLHSEAAASMVKQWMLAALGYSIQEEDAANEEIFGELDFDFDYDEDEDEVTIGEGWNAPEGRRIRMTCSLDIDDSGNKRQQYGSYIPV